MSLTEEIRKSMVAGMKSGDRDRVEALRYLRAQIQNREIGLRHPLTDEETVELLRTEAKRRKEAIEMYQKGGRRELADKETKQLKIMGEFLPKQISDEELNQIIKKAAEGAGGSNNFGGLMKKVMGKVKGKADGARIAAVLKKFMAGGR